MNYENKKSKKLSNLSGFDKLSLDISAVERKRRQARNSASDGRHTNDTANGGYSKSRKLTNVVSRLFECLLLGVLQAGRECQTIA